MKILFVLGSRGEWGYIRPLIQLAKNALSPSSEFLNDNLQKAGFLIFMIYICIYHNQN